MLGIVKTTVEDNSIKYGEFGTLTYSEASEALKVLLESGDEVNLV
ncbi:diguanylate cyclase and metal dependent phosphohydrolase [Alicyclobacillus hesperidum URH17-3-68]|nr:diguanylate cyclase and metal dependent phosphohydrolase [Alicyclobacillus hesperidum URH17-3-68]